MSISPGSKRKYMLFSETVYPQIIKCTVTRRLMENKFFFNKANKGLKVE